MATDTLPRPADFADELLTLIDSDDEAGRFDRRTGGRTFPVSFADLHDHVDANEYLLEAGEVLGITMWTEEGGIPDPITDLCNAACEVVNEVMAKPCDACGEPLGAAAPRVTDEGTFHGRACPADLHRVR